MTLMWETLNPALVISSVSTDRTKSPGLESDSLTRNVPGSPRSRSSFSALGPDKWPWYHLKIQKQQRKKEMLDVLIIEKK